MNMESLKRNGKDTLLRLSRLADYIALTSPRITLLVMMTGFAGMWVASGGVFQKNIFFWCLLGIGLSSSGASVYNNWYDRNIDKLMKRTEKRPIPNGRISAKAAFLFATCLTVTSVLIMGRHVNMLSAVLTALAVITYSGLYTVVLKRRTPLATEIGGISGALPPLIGWGAVRGDIEFEAILLSAILFFWQPPHFWHLAMKYKRDYVRARIPSLPSVAGDETVRLRILQYVICLVAVSILPYIAGMLGNLYMVCATALGIVYVAIALLDLNARNMKRGFHYSIAYMFILLIALVIDVKWHY